MEKITLVIVGGGCAGYTAAIYAVRAGIPVLLLEGLVPGGQLATTMDVENYPGFPESVKGPWLMDQMRQQAKNLGARVEQDAVTSLTRVAEGNFVLETEFKKSYEACALIIATGASAKWLGLESEERYRGRGVSACATCDGFFFKDKAVAVVGGGDAAARESLYLAGLASSVTMIHRRDKLRTEKALQEKLSGNSKITLLYSYVVDEVLGHEDASQLYGLNLKSTKDGSIRMLEVAGLFVAIGHTPSTQILEGLVELDDVGYVKTIPGTTKTSVPGIFAAGDAQDRIYRQAVTAAGTGCMATLDAEQYLADVSVGGE